MTSEARNYAHLVQPDRVHGDIYLDPDIFEQEMERIFHRGWVYLAHESEFPEPGDFRTSWVGRQPIILTRDEKRQVHVLLNRCTHRAASICQAERGNARLFQCAYHGWSFRNTGELAGVPYADGYGPDFRKEDFGLRSLPRVDSYRGFLFGSVQPTGITLREHLGAPVMEQMDLVCDLSPSGHIDLSAGTHRYGFDGNWKLQVENTIDGYHPNFTHQAFFKGVKQRMGMNMTLFEGSSGGFNRDLGNGHTLLDSREFTRTDPLSQRRVDMIKLMAKPYYEALVDRHGEAHAEDLLRFNGTHMNIFPNLMLLQNQIRVVRPIHVGRTDIHVQPALLQDVPDVINTMRLRMHEQFYGPAGGGNPDDAEMFERVQVGLRASVDPWLFIGRGLHRERQDSDGTRYGQMTDELSQRGILHHWRDLMLDGEPRES